ncbi:xanthine dehydrogenase family protein molybdopterin-binding subunit [Mesobaculum littorinae]|uniref:Xanthine dehydrogenase family protein molybdopterin-binding subunit n=1 Tax=Mesobaculum littorinae TaxID=2486419 RepID=A0A438AKY8_9RHOB|nr:xanthine dehydrogenase family protein molybdopterin-binding subunit [Mesobaculum littorinae]RVV99329.1 xanthine dehydrogenase family protein molybdopterin-binding subunit [Mesobaculum littorinae]
MTLHLKLDNPDEENRLDHMAQGVIGTGANRPDGALKVSGQATYAAEWQRPDMAYGVLVRATVPAGKVEKIDASAVEAMPGIVKVITDPKLLRVPAQGMADAAPAQGNDEVLYFGQPIALVVGDSFEAARHGANHLSVSYLPQEARLDPDAVQTERPEGKQSSQGDLDGVMKTAPVTLDEVWTTPGHNSSAMEPHASMAEWDGDRLTLHGSYQMLKYNRNELADSLGIDPKNVRILSPYVGGGFGSKLGISPEAVAAALAARDLGRPVRVVMPRQQVFETITHRAQCRQRIRLAADETGKLLGIGHDNRVYNLPDEGFAEPVTQATPFTYAAENRAIGQEVATINRVIAGSVRAPGEAIGVPIFENAMDEMAEKLGMDPLEFRLKNIPETPPGQDIPFSSNMLAEALRDGAEKFGWDKRNPTPGAVQEGEWLIGMGMASAVRVNMLMESKARITLTAEGATVETDMTDIGTGTYAILTQIAGELLGLPMEKVTTKLGDTDLPPGSGSGGSFGAASSGTSVYLAAMELRRQIADKLDCDEADLTLKDGQAIAANKTHALADLVGETPFEAEGHIEPGDIASKAFQATFGSHFAEVAVNRHTGETRVRRMLGTFACGRVLNEKTARSQCLGGMTFGIGMALTEEMLFDTRDGHVVNNDFAEYHLPVNLDVPKLEVHFLQERDPYANPMQAKGIGELGICGAAAAVTNAIHNATGVRIRDYPATLDKILPYLP